MDSIAYIIKSVSEIEKNAFFEFWDEESIKDSLKLSYNNLLAACICKDKAFDKKLCEDDIIIYNIEGGVAPKLFCMTEKMICSPPDMDEQLLVFGYVIYNIVAEESELLRIAVDKSFRENGLGSLLMKHYISNIRYKTEKSLLEVREGNKAAIKLYKKFDYEKIATRKKYYSNPEEDAFIYSLGLP